ncbi:MAG TPA: M14 family metallopeptidase [Anaerolineae bacterium]|nr:M14 family metallopeptidase [Anaerolineae bacterium]
MSTLFPRDYEESRATFRQDLERVQARWPNARLESHCLAGDEAAAEDLTIDWIHADGLQRQDRLLLFTAGIHGLEAHVGAGIFRLFVQEFLPRLDPSSTGLLFVHAINPWGMQHRRRTNRANVDLNRNFVWDTHLLDRSFNAGYGRLTSLLNPREPVRAVAWESLSFLFRLLWSVASLGLARFRHDALLGQYCFPQGLYYGGAALQEETQVLMGLYRKHIPKYSQVVHLDVHSGYGPRYQMSIVNSAMEPRDSAELARRFSYPLVVKANPDEFYSMRGDMIDYVYTLVYNQFPNVRLYATSFEFGTLGDSIARVFRSLRALVFENRLYWSGARNRSARERVEREFQELFYPQDERWRTRAISDARQAIQGILGAEGYLSRTSE